MFVKLLLLLLFLNVIICVENGVVNKRSDIDLQTCIDNFNIHKDKIIRTQDSREMGAKYLNEIDLGSREECLRLCCETDTCDVFVYEEKVNFKIIFILRLFCVVLITRDNNLGCSFGIYFLNFIFIIYFVSFIVSLKFS